MTFSNIQKNKHLNILTLLMFFNMTGFSILIPIMPSLFVNQYSEFYIVPGYISHDFAFLIQGVLLMVYALSVFLAAPVLGELSDYYGRKPILYICFLGSALGYFLFSYAILSSNMWLLFISRIIDGITGGNISVMKSSMVDVLEESEKAKTLSKRMGSIGIGLVLGGWLGGVLSSKDVFFMFDLYTPFIFAGSLSLFSMYLLYRGVLETRFKVNDTDLKDLDYHNYNKFYFSKLHPLHSLKLIVSGFKIKKLKPLFYVLLLFFIGFSIYTSFSQNLLVIRFGFDTKTIGYYFAFTGIILAISQVFLVPKLNKYFSPKSILKFSYPIFAVSFFIYGLFINSIFGLIIFATVFVFLVSIFMTNNSILIINNSSDSNRGKILGITSSVESLGQTIAPILGGLIASFVSYSAPFYLSSIFICFATIIIWRQD